MSTSKTSAPPPVPNSSPDPARAGVHPLAPLTLAPLVVPAGPGHTTPPNLPPPTHQADAAPPPQVGPPPAGVKADKHGHVVTGKVVENLDEMRLIIREKLHGYGIRITGDLAADLRAALRI